MKANVWPEEKHMFHLSQLCCENFPHVWPSGPHVGDFDHVSDMGPSGPHFQMWVQVVLISKLDLRFKVVEKPSQNASNNKKNTQRFDQKTNVIDVKYLHMYVQVVLI